MAKKNQLLLTEAEKEFFGKVSGDSELSEKLRSKVWKNNSDQAVRPSQNHPPEVSGQSHDLPSLSAQDLCGIFKCQARKIPGKAEQIGHPT